MRKTHLINVNKIRCGEVNEDELLDGKFISSPTYNHGYDETKRKRRI